MKRWTLKRGKAEATIIAGDGKMKFGFPIAQYPVIRLLVIAHNKDTK